METQTITAPDGATIREVTYDSNRITYIIEPTKEDIVLPPDRIELPDPIDKFEAFRLAHQIADRYNDNSLSWHSEAYCLFKATGSLGSLLVWSCSRGSSNLDPKFKRRYMAADAARTYPNIFNMLYQ